MKKNKLLFLIIILLMCTGCTVEYNINITADSIDETIVVNDYPTYGRTKNQILKHYNMWYPVFVNFIKEGETIEIEDFSDKVDGIEYYQKNLQELNNGYQYSYKYNYNIEEYYDSYALATAFIEPKVHITSDALILRTSQKNLLCNYDYFDSLKVNITIDPKIYKLNTTNSQDIYGNTYSWTLDRNNCDNSQILLTLNIDDQLIEDLDDQEDDKTVVQKENPLSNYALYIFCGILLILIFIGYKIYKKIKEKNENFNEDD